MKSLTSANGSESNFRFQTPSQSTLPCTLFVPKDPCDSLESFGTFFVPLTQIFLQTRPISYYLTSS
ncbi:hypothetical protein IFVP22_C220329 [Vibrio parahaemolyticus]